MTLDEAHKQLLQALYHLYDAREAANIADMVMEHATGQRRIDRIIHKHAPVSEAVQHQLQEHTRLLLLHTPVQYILHEAWFAGMQFYVDENVLIPRPETEELVEWVESQFQVSSFKFQVTKEEEEQFEVSSLKFEVTEEKEKFQVSSFKFQVTEEKADENNTQSQITENPAINTQPSHKLETSNLKLETVVTQPSHKLETSNLKLETGSLLDIGTGSGCIPIALKKRLPGWQVHALDVSEGALQVAQKNASQLSADIIFYQADILDETQWPRLPMFDVIVSNPPYIPISEAAAMQPNVTAFEPHTALFVPDSDPLLFYHAIAAFALLHLHPGGLLFFEIHESLGPAVCALLAQQGFAAIELKQDMQGKDRMVQAKQAKQTPAKPPTPPQ